MTDGTILEKKYSVNSHYYFLHSTINAPPKDGFKTPVNCPLGRIQRGLAHMRGQPLTLYEREQIELYVRGRWSQRSIARKLHRDHSVVSRELARNTDKDGVYRSAHALARADKRKSQPHTHKLDEDDVLRNHVAQRLQDGWSPEQISGRLKNRPDSQVAGSYVCHETIYRWIYEGEGRFMGLYQHLTRKHKKRQRRFNRKHRKDKGMLYLTPIRFRPLEIEEKKVFGHWESDSVISRESRAALSVQRERVCHLTCITKVPDMTAESTEAVLRDRVESMPRGTFQSITFDRGGEGANHWKLRMDYDIDTYQCDPYKSYQKGAVENTNGLIRRTFPKGTDFSLITDQQIYAVQEKLNNRARKSLQYKTPHESYQELTGQVVH